MGSSLRRSKRFRPKATIKPKRKPQQKSRPPPHTQGGSLQAKLPLGCGSAALQRVGYIAD